MGILEKVRHWIDGETTEHGLEEAALSAQVRPRSESEEFIVRIARAIEDVMQREMVTLPQGTAMLPTEYTIFLGVDDHAEWQGVKRRGLEKGLHHILSERAMELAGGRTLEGGEISIKLKKDPTIDAGDFRIVHGWTDTAGQQKTELLIHTTVDTSAARTVTEDLEEAIPADTADITEQAPDLGYEADVSKRPVERFVLEIWQDGDLQNSVPVYKDHLVIGRGSKSRPVDIALVGDIGISRHHLHLHSDLSGLLSVTHEGRNPTTVNGVPLRPGEVVSVDPGTSIEVCSYTLIVKSQR